MNLRVKLIWIVDYLVRSKPGFLMMGGVVFLALGHVTGNISITNVGWAFIIFAIVLAVILEIEVWAWNKVIKRRDGALSSSRILTLF